MTMSIKYGELTIIHNEEETNIFTNLAVWFGYEQSITANNKMICLFEDGEVYDINEAIKGLDFKFNFSKCSIINNLPLWFNKKRDDNQRNTTFFYKTPVQNENKKCMSVTLFTRYTKYCMTILAPSIYNCIYYCINYNEQLCNKEEIFGIVRIKSSETMPRFHFAYDSSLFSKEDTMYLLRSIFIRS